MRYRWPAETAFIENVLTVEQEDCELCHRALNICDHRFHRIFTLQGPMEIVCKLARCPDPDCPAHAHTKSPLAESQITLPWWLIGWDVFCWMGFRRFTRHWSIPQLQAELHDNFRIRLSDDAISGYLQRYRCMVAARHQDATLLAEHYKHIDSLVLTIDGLQPEKGHETLYVVRELRGKRVWFAEALLSSSADELRRLIVKAKQWAVQLGKPVELWMSDKQDAFLSGIAAEFPGVPHRYCQNHFLRELAKPLLKADSQAKVKMRKKVRGLRDIERQVLEDRREAQARAKDDATSPDGASPAATQERLAGVTPLSEPGGTEPPRAVVAEQTAAHSTTGGPPEGNTTQAGASEAASRQAACEPAAASSGTASESDGDAAGQVVLDYCAAVRGILNDDQGGPLRPPGLRMAEALQEVRESLQRNLGAKKGGAPRSSCASSRAASTAACRKSPGNKSRSKSTLAR